MKRDSQCYEAPVNATISDEKLEQVIRDRLRNNPPYYLNFLKKLVDEIDENIPDDIFFELLRPSLLVKNGESGISDSIRLDDMSIEFTSEDLLPVPSPESVDMLFRPGVRRKLYDWQRALFDGNLRYNERENALNNIKKVFYSLTQDWKDGLGATPTEDKGGSDIEYDKVYDICKKIFKKRNRDLSIKEYFPDVGNLIVQEITDGSLYITTPEKLRDIVLARKFEYSEKEIQEFIRGTYSAVVPFRRQTKNHPQAKATSDKNNAKDIERIHEHKKMNIVNMKSAKKNANSRKDSKPGEKREQKRFVERCKVEFIADGTTFRGISSDFSLSGLFIKTTRPLAPGTILDIIIYLPDGVTSKLKGKVQRAVEIPFGKAMEMQKYLQRGIGVEIIEKDTSYLHFIRSLLGSESFRKRSAWSGIREE